VSFFGVVKHRQNVVHIVQCHKALYRGLYECIATDKGLYVSYFIVHYVEVAKSACFALDKKPTKQAFFDILENRLKPR
jgi:hypothetical protein